MQTIAYMNKALAGTKEKSQLQNSERLAGAVYIYRIIAATNGRRQPFLTLN
jgi:hypothetical protein